MQRRTLLAAGAIVGAASGFTGAARADVQPETGISSGAPLPLPYQSIPGFLSAKQLAVHHRAHYGGALSAFLKIDAALDAVARGAASEGPDGFGGMQRTRTSKANSVLLHELYFAGMSPRSSQPGADVQTALKHRFGSEDRWRADFLSCAAAASGWALLVSFQGRLYNLVSDEHAVGLLVGCEALLALDVYEHAFYVDYENRKTDYCSAFMDHIDWIHLTGRLASVASNC
jgi:Fe-Mn family superoxide dismutase